MRSVAPTVHPSVRLLPQDTGSDVPPQKERSLVFWIQMGEIWRARALSRIHAHGLIIPAPVAAVCISVFGAFHHRPFVSESIPSPLSPAFPSSHLFVPLIYGGIEVRGRRING